MPPRTARSADCGADDAYVVLVEQDAVGMSQAPIDQVWSPNRSMPMNAFPVLAVSGGAGCGALLRWWLGGWLNPVFPTIPLGTVVANLVGGLLVGVANGFFAHHPGMAAEWRLLVITGFMGGLTTFSTFSIEVVTLLARGEYGWALGASGLHLFGSLSLAAVGLLAANAVFIKV